MTNTPEPDRQNLLTIGGGLTAALMLAEARLRALATDLDPDPGMWQPGQPPVAERQSALLSIAIGEIADIVQAAERTEAVLQADRLGVYGSVIDSLATLDLQEADTIRDDT